MTRWIKFALYAAITAAGIGLVYPRVADGLRDGAAASGGWGPLIAWSAVGVYLAGYAFLLAAEAGMRRGHRIGFEIAAFAIFCAAAAGRMLGL